MMESAMHFLRFISQLVVPAVIALCGAFILFSKKPLFDTFISGAKRGFECAIGLFPTLCVLICAVSMLSACGFTQTVTELLSGIGIPEGLAPFLITRPISGAASTAALTDIFEKYGADSQSGISASIIMASSDTLIYVISVYESASGIKRARTVLPASLIAMLVATIAAIIAARAFYGG